MVNPKVFCANTQMLHRLWWTGFIVNQKRSVVEAHRRLKLGMHGSNSILNFYNNIPKFRLPDTSPADYYNYGAGDRGVFISRSKATKKIDNVALSARASSDKDIYFIGGPVFGVNTLRAEVPKKRVQSP